MYLYFNEKGILKEIVNDEAIRLGNNDLNHIYIYWENAPEVDSMWVKFKLPNGETTNELSYSHIKVKKVIPYDKQRDLKYFKDYVSYDFFDISIPDGLNEDGEVVGINVLAEDGLVSASVRFVLTLGQAISTLGLITFNVEKSVIQADLGINQSQFDYLLKHCLLNTTDTIIYKVDDITSVDASKIPNNAILMTTITTDLTAPNPLWVEFYINNDGSLENIGLTEHYDIDAPIRGWKSGKIYYGYISANYNNILNLSGFYIGYNLGSKYYILNKGKWYETSYTLGHGQVIVTQSTSNGLTQLTNLLVDENMQVRGQIYKGVGTPTEDEEVLTRGEIKEEFVEQVKTGTAPRVYGVDSNDEQVMYEVRNQTIPNSIVQRDANGRAYILTPTHPAHIANKGYVDGEITTLRDDLMGYTDDEVTGAIAGLKDESGKIRSDLLPSYVDDVVEYSSKGAFPARGEKGKIYLDLSTNEIWRWSGSEYFEIKSGDYYLRANGEKLELDLEKLEKVTPTDIVADGNTIKLYHDNNEITGQNEPVTFKTINGESIIGNGDIEVSGVYNYDISPATAVVGTLTSEIVTALSDTNATITRAGELYRYSDNSDSEYLTYIHTSIDTSQVDKTAVMRAIRINLTTYAWELLDYDLTKKEYITKKETVNRIKDLTYGKNLIITSFIIPETINDVTITACGKNLLDTSESSVRGDEAILNDNGQPIYDYNSKYFLKKIAVIPNETLYMNFGVQRIYQYDINGNWLRRTPASGGEYKALGKWIVPSDCYYIQIQYVNVSANLSNAQIEVGEAETFYEPHRENSITINKNSIVPIKNLLIYEDFTRLYSNFDITFSISYDFPKNIVILPACKTYDLWEPTYTTDEYQAPIGRKNVEVAITYYEFLAKYYDIYLGTNSDGYKVVKRSLGHDASHRYEVMEYDFIPQNYNRVVLLSAGMNPCELPAEWGLAFFIKSVMENHNEDEGLQYIYENVRIKVIPVINAWGFDQTPKSYLNYNEIRINKNFNYKDSWDTMGDNQFKGEEPDSEEEVLILKKWLNENANLAELYIDCHTDPDNNTPNNIWAHMSPGLESTIRPVVEKIITYYRNKGLDENEELLNGAYFGSYKSYPKTIYAKEVCGINTIQIEIWSNTTALGSDPAIMNEDAEIRHYTLLLRSYILALLKRKEIILVKEE